MSGFLRFGFNGVAPICLLLALGAFLKAIRVLDGGAARTLNRLCYQVLLPLKLFDQLAGADITSVTDPTLLAVTVGGTASVILLLCALVPRFVPPGPERGEMIQGIFRGESAILGIPLITNLYGEAAGAVLAVPLPLMLILYNVAAPVVLALYSGVRKPSPGEIARKVAANPLLIGVAAGILVSLSGLRLPAAAADCVGRLGNAGSTLALVALGAMVDLKDFKKSGRLALTAALLRLVAISGAMLALAALLGLRNERLAVVVCFFSTPSAVGGYVLAQNMDGDGRLSGQILVVTTLLSVLTLFGTLSMLRYLTWM